MTSSIFAYTLQFAYNDIYYLVLIEWYNSDDCNYCHLDVTGIRLCQCEDLKTFYVPYHYRRENFTFNTIQ